MNGPIVLRNPGQLARRGVTGTLIYILRDAFERLDEDQIRSMAMNMADGLRSGLSITDNMLQAARNAGVSITRGFENRINHISEYIRDQVDTQGIMDIIRDETNNPGGDSTGLIENTSESTMKDKDEEMTPEPTAAGAMTLKSGATGRTHKAETPLVPLYKTINKPWPSVIQQKCVYYHNFSTSVGNGACYAGSWRLNSIYDCYNNNAYSGAEVTAATADAADGTVQRPTYAAYWLNFYKYWSVVRSRYRIRVYSQPNDTVTYAERRDLEDIMYVYHHGAQFPPKDIGGGLLVPHYAKRENKGMYYIPMRYNPANSGKHLHESIITASGNWSPGSIKHEIMEDELAQVWHKPTEVPPTPEWLTIHIQQSPLSTFDQSRQFRVEITLEYETQFKDLLVGYEYPTTVTDVPAISDFASLTA